MMVVLSNPIILTAMLMYKPCRTQRCKIKAIFSLNSGVLLGILNYLHQDLQIFLLLLSTLPLKQEKKEVSLAISLLPDLTCDAACLKETTRPGRVRLPVALTHDSHGDSSGTMLGKHGLPREPSKHVMTPQRGEKNTLAQTHV